MLLASSILNFPCVENIWGAVGERNGYFPFAFLTHPLPIIWFLQTWIFMSSWLTLRPAEKYSINFLLFFTEKRFLFLPRHHIRNVWALLGEAKWRVSFAWDGRREIWHKNSRVEMAISRMYTPNEMSFRLEQFLLYFRGLKPFLLPHGNQQNKSQITFSLHRK